MGNAPGGGYQKHHVTSSNPLISNSFLLDHIRRVDQINPFPNCKLNSIINMPKKPPKKPAQTYGHIAFSKKGKVTKHVQTLSDVTKKQEEHIAKLFCSHFPDEDFEDVNLKYEMLPEHDHDFKLFLKRHTIEVQVTEINPEAEFLELLTKDEWVDGQTGFTAFQIGDGGQMYGINEEKRDNLIAKRIQQKQAKHYQKPKYNELWLCIFSNDVEINPIKIEGGKLIKSEAAIRAETHCKSVGIEPFSCIWFLCLGFRPHQVWPL